VKRLVVLLLAAAAFTAALPAAEPLLFYSRTFPKSAPPYIQVTVTKGGDAEYREAVDDDLPVKFKMSSADTATLFGLAEKLDYFKHPIEAPVKVAFTGDKVFRYDDGAQKTEVKFNYSMDPTAQALLDWFEHMAEAAQDRTALERAAKYDHLGVMQALIGLESSLGRGRVAAPEQFLPLLDRIANNQVYMHTARARAAELAESIRNPKK
jgi:hypothetical protein